MVCPVLWTGGSGVGDRRFDDDDNIVIARRGIIGGRA
jgi:hypothetical protein